MNAGLTTIARTKKAARNTLSSSKMTKNLAHASSAGSLAMQEPRPIRQERARVVVIDDDATIRSLVSLHLVNAGYDVQEAQDAIEGGHAVLRAPPDLIICDVNMPYMNGYEFVAALKADPLTKDIPVAFISTNDDVADHAARLGAVAYLKKPVFADKLLELAALFTAR